MMIALVVGSMLATTTHAMEDPKIFIGQFNRALEQFASSSQFKVSYKDVEHVDDPMIGEYLSLIDTDITVVSGKLTYVFNANRITIDNEGDHIYTLGLPGSLVMKMQSGEQEDMFLVTLGGRPNIQLRHTPGTDRFEVKLEKKERPFSPSLRKDNRLVGANLRNVAGQLQFLPSEVSTRGWQRLTPIPQGTIAGYVEKLCTAFNSKIQHLYPDYMFKGCVWSKR